MNSVIVEFTQEDLNLLTALLDAAVKATGLQGAKPALAIMAKLESAIAAKARTDHEKTH